MQPTSLTKNMDQTSQASLGAEAVRRAAMRARKAGLLVDAARHFASISRPSRHDITIFKELFYQLVAGADKGERRTISATLARNPYTPRTVLLYLALDDADIAAPVLLFCEALNEVDIIGLARRVSQGHLEILCRRARLTAPAAEQLIRHGGGNCREILSRNTALRADPAIVRLLAGGAAAEPQDPGESIAKVEVAQPSRSIETAEAAEASQQAEEAAPAKSAAPAKPSRPALAEAPALASPTKAAAQGRAQADLLSLAALGGRLGRKQETDRMDEAAHDPALPLERQALRVARLRSGEKFAAFAKSFCGLSASLSAEIIASGDPDAILVLLKGLGLGDVGALQCLIHLAPQVARDNAVYRQAKETVGRIDAASCRALVESMGAKFEARSGREALAETPASALLAAAALRRREIGAGPAQRRHEPIATPASGGRKAG